jgi:hypothetical protein
MNGQYQAVEFSGPPWYLHAQERMCQHERELGGRKSG